MPTRATKIQIIGLLILNIIVWGFYSYSYLHIGEGEIKMALLEETMKDNLKKEEIMMVLSKNLGETAVNRNKISELVIQKDGEVDFIKSLEDLVAKHNLKSEIKSVKVEVIANSNSLENLVVKIDVIGEWSDINAFEKSLEEIPLSLSLEGFTLGKFDSYVVKGKQSSQWIGGFDFKVAKIKE